MRAARILLTAFAALLLVIIAAAWTLPGLLDWNRYRPTVERLASVTLGQPVTIRGPVGLALLPEPVLVAGDVRVGDRAAPLFRASALRLRVALWPLLAGHIDARELVLRGPELSIPWPLRAGPLPLRPPDWLTSFSARIEGGRVVVGDVAVTGIDGTLAADSSGAVRAAGTGHAFGRVWVFAARLTAPGGNGAAGLDLSVSGQGADAGAGASFAGQLAADGTLAGRVTAAGPDLSRLMPAPAVPFQAEGRLTAAEGLIEADELALRIAGAPATGAVALRVSPVRRLDVALAASRFDLDAWFPALLHAAPGALPVSLDLSAEAAPLAGGLLRHIRAAFDLARGRVVLREATAVLPGDAAVTLRGVIDQQDASHPRFDGAAALRAPALRATLRWLAATGGLNADKLPAGVLGAAELRGHVLLARGALALDDVRGTLDGTTVAGRFGVQAGSRPVLAADVTVDRLALDPWLQAVPSPLEVMRFSAASFDADMKLRATAATCRGEVLHDLTLDAAASPAGLDLRAFQATLRGARLIAHGTLADGRLADAALDVAAPAAAPLAALLPPAWRATPAFWRGAGTAHFDAAGPSDALALHVTAELDDARLDAAPTVDLTRGRWTGPLTLRHPGASRLIASLGLPARLGLASAPAWLGDGSLSLVAQMTVAPRHLAAGSFDLTAAALHAKGALALDVGDDAPPRLSGRIVADTLPLPFPVGSTPLPLAALQGWQAALHVEASRLLLGLTPVPAAVAGDVALADGTLRVTGITGRIGGGTLAGAASFDSIARPPALALQLALRGVAADRPFPDLPLGLLTGRTDGTLRLSASGYSAAALLATLTGTLGVNVAAGAASGFDLFRVKLAADARAPAGDDTSLAGALRSGSTSFDRLDLQADAAQGMITLHDAALTGSAGQAALAGTIALPDGALDLRLSLRPAVPDPPEVAVRLTGKLDDPRRTPEIADLLRWQAAQAP